jgi:hypothetical protein
MLMHVRCSDARTRMYACMSTETKRAHSPGIRLTSVIPRSPPVDGMVPSEVAAGGGAQDCLWRAVDGLTLPPSSLLVLVLLCFCVCAPVYVRIFNFCRYLQAREKASGELFLVNTRCGDSVIQTHTPGIHAGIAAAIRLRNCRRECCNAHFKGRASGCC